MLLTDYRLAMKCFFEPATNYRYRLTGPGAWEGAREAIMSQIDRTYYPLTDGQYMRKQKTQSSSNTWTLWIWVAIVMAVVVKFTLL